LSVGPSYFSNNKTSHTKLADACFLDERIRFNYVKINQKYTSEIENETANNLESLQSNQKRIILSYWGSTLSTGVNLEQLDVCSADLRYSIPFIFIFFSKIKSNKDLKNFIQKSLCNALLQIVSRIARGKGDTFKYIILTRYKSGLDFKNVLLDFFKPFASKFRSFKVYDSVILDKIQIGYLKTLKTRKSSLVPTQENFTELKGFEKILDTHPHKLKCLPFSLDFTNYVEGLDLTTKKEYKKLLTRNQSDLKLTLSSNRATVNFSITDGFGNLETFTFIIVSVSVTRSIACLSFLDVKSSKIQHFKITDSNIKTFLDTCDIMSHMNLKIILLGFNSNKFDGPLLCSLLERKFDDVASLYQYKLELEHQEKVSIRMLNSRVYKFVDLRVMCGAPRTRLSVFDVGVQLNSLRVPSTEEHQSLNDLKTFHEVKLCILKDLYIDLFSENNVLVFDSCVKLLSASYNFTPTFDYLVDVFTGAPSNRLRDLYLLALNIKGFKHNLALTGNTVLKCTNIIKVINQLDWVDERCKDALLSFYSQSFQYIQGKKGFYIGVKEKMKLELQIRDGPVLNITSGGINSKRKNIRLETSDSFKVFDFDIVLFYANLASKYGLLMPSPLGKFLKDLIQRREIALSTGRTKDAEAYKSILNVIMGDLGSSFSDIFDPQVRFDLIQLTQVVMVHLISNLVSKHFLVHAV